MILFWHNMINNREIDHHSTQSNWAFLRISFACSGSCLDWWHFCGFLRASLNAQYFSYAWTLIFTQHGRFRSVIQRWILRINEEALHWRGIWPSTCLFFIDQQRRAYSGPGRRDHHVGPAPGSSRRILSLDISYFSVALSLDEYFRFKCSLLPTDFWACD